ncbi:hypothetical protein AB0O01_13915 [Streptomyces sp. NPDC093252]|uniref:hypothetical protein n=1 Tax=Streptomyces sp. NPDC093252 TaxID=3154980 RepID=UPI00342160E9
MAMVGLFWITEGDVYLGSKPSGLAPGVRLTPEGVLALGDRQSALYPWEDVRSLTVTDVPVQTLRRRAGAVTDLALGTVGAVLDMAPGPYSGLAEGDPALMTVRVETPDATHEPSVYVAAATGYTASEAALSHTVLARLTEGAATMSTTLSAMADWGRTAGPATPKRAAREQLLRTWAQ